MRTTESQPTDEPNTTRKQRDANDMQASIPRLFEFHFLMNI